MMKHLKALVDTFETRSYQEGTTTFFEVSKGNKVVATLATAGPTSMFLWGGKAHKRNGQLKTAGRQTLWNSTGHDFQVECDRLLYRSVATELTEQAQSMF